MISEYRDKLFTFWLKTQGKDIERQVAEAEQATRRGLYDTLLQCEADLQSAKDTHEPLIAAAVAKEQEAHALLEAARVRTSTVAQAARAAYGSLECDRTRLLSALRADADPKIRAARVVMYQRYSDACGRSGDTRDVLACVEERPMFAGHENPVTVWNNTPAVERLARAIREAAAKLDQLLVVFAADVDLAIAEILAPVEAAWESVYEMTDRTPASVRAAYEEEFGRQERDRSRYRARFERMATASLVAS